MKKKKMKLPRLFRKTYSEKALERKILRRIHIPADQIMVKELFSRTEEGKWVIESEPTEEKRKELKSLTKAIKKNKGIVTTWKAAIILVPMVLILLFNVLFKNQIAERTAEKSLENLFEAAVDIDELRISILKGNVSFQALSIADKDNPMRNLIEAGPGLVNINTWELAFKRFHIDEISLKGVEWNTARTVNGSLTGSESKLTTNKDEPKKDDTKAISPLMDLAGDVDYLSLLENRKEDLQSLSLIKGTNEQTDSLTEKWSGKLDEKEKDILSLKNQINSFASINTDNLKDPAEIRSLINQADSLTKDVKSFKEDILQLNRDFKTDKASVISLAGNLPSAVESDLTYLEESLDFSTGGFQSLAADLAEDFIKSRWNSYYEGGVRAWNLYRKISSNKQKEGKRNGTVFLRDTGKTILFPSPDKPTFYLDKLLVNGRDETLAFEFKLSSISNEPDKIDQPVSLDLSIEEGSLAVKGSGFLDLRKNSEQIFILNVNGTGIPLELPDGIKGLGINHLSSQASLSGRLSSLRDSGLVISQWDINLENVSIEQSKSSGFLHDALVPVFRKNNSIELTGTIEAGQEGIESIHMDTDFDRILNQSIGYYITDLEKKAFDELETSLMNYLEPALTENETLKKTLEQLGIQSAGQIDSIDSLEAIVENHIVELDKLTGSLTGNFLNKAKDAIKLPGF